MKRELAWNPQTPPGDWGGTDFVPYSAQDCTVANEAGCHASINLSVDVDLHELGRLIGREADRLSERLRATGAEQDRDPNHSLGGLGDFHRTSAASAIAVSRPSFSRPNPVSPP